MQLNFMASVAVLFALIFLFVSFIPALCYQTKDGACDDIFKSDSADVSCERFISASYFRNYQNLVNDFDFQFFISNKLRTSPAQTLLRVTESQRKLVGEGSHRVLYSSFRFISPNSDSMPDLSTSGCEVIIIERLPSGVFADPFELEHLLQRGVFKDGTVLGDTNLELPSFVSNRSMIEIHVDAASSNVQGNVDVLELKVEIPVHVRYPSIGETEFSTVRFEEPDLLMRCDIKSQSESKGCLVTMIDRDVEMIADPIVWRVPCGMKAHSGIVSVLTFGSAVIATLSILVASLYHSANVSIKSLKQS